MPYTNNFTDSTATATVHAAHHNEVATGLTNLENSARTYVYNPLGQWYDGRRTTGVYGGGSSQAANTIWLVPLYCGRTSTIDAVGAYVSAVTSGTTARFAVYGPGDLNPASLAALTLPLLAQGATQTMTVAAQYMSNVSVSMTRPGWVLGAYWFSAATSVYTAGAPTVCWPASGASSVAYMGFSVASTTVGASGFPATISNPTLTFGQATSVPAISIRLAA